MIVLNGMLILVPVAFYLNANTASVQFDTCFYGQAIEIIAGAVNLTLVDLNLRDAQTHRRRSKRDTDRVRNL